MAIISNFPVERDWGEFIDELAREVISGIVELPLETQSGRILRTRADEDIEAYNKNSYANLIDKPTVNGIELGANTTGEALNLVSVATFNALLARVVALEQAITTLNQTNFIISRASGE